MSYSKLESDQSCSKKIVVAIDGSDEASHALKVACDLANKYGSQIHLVHSPQLETMGIAVGSGAVEIKPSPEKIAEAGKKITDDAVATASALGCTLDRFSVGSGDPAKEILMAIDDSNADLVVMGRRGLGGFQVCFLAASRSR